MSESEPSEAQLQEDLFQSDDVDQPEQPFVEELELQSVEEATALLRSCWKFAAVIQFSRMFAAPLKLKVFAADILESALISPDNHRMFLSELLFKLLRTDALQPYSEKDSEGWESLLYRKVSTKWPEHFESHPLLGTTFYDITPTKRVDLLFALCDWRVHDCPVVKDVIKRTVEMADSSVDGLRQEPVGEDTKGNLYYYFSFNNEDCRLYRQEPPFKKSAKRRRSGGEDAQWETVCTTVEEMADFVESLSAARIGKDKALHDLIATDILPQLIESAAARRRAEEKQAAIEAMPKKRSSRLQELTSKKEEEDKRKAQQLAEKLHRQRENERIRKEREREERLLARQREDERQMDIQRKPRSTRRRTFQETFAWSPLDVPVPQRRRTDLDLRPRKNVAGLVAAAQGMSTGFGRNRRGKWVLNDQVEEAGPQEVRVRSGGRPRSTKAASLSTAGPSSPAASWDSGAGRTQPKKLPHYASSQQQYALEHEPTTSYGQQQLPPQQQQQWQDPQQSGYATQSAPYASSSTMWQQPQQQQQPQQPATQSSQQQQQQQYQQQLQQLTLSRLSPQQMQQLHALPVEQRAMQFGSYMRETQVQLQQQQHMQQQFPSQAMPTYSSSMVPAYPSSTGEQTSRPMSPPGLPRGPSNPMVVAQSQRSQAKSPTGGYLGPKMIRPQMTGSGPYANPGQPGIMQGPSMQGQRPSPAGMAMHGQVPVTNQLTSAHSSGSGNAMSHSGQTFVGSAQATNPYGSRNGMPAGPYNNGGSQSANPYAVGSTSQGMGSYGSTGTNPYGGASPRSGVVSVPNGVVQSGVGVGPQTSLHQPQKQPSAAADEQQTQTAVAPQPGPATSAEVAALDPAAAAASSQDPSQQAAANEMPGKSVLGARADPMQDVKQPDGVHLASSNQENADTSDLDVLADAPQLIEPPMVGGQENFSDALFAD
ncbi:hypothetical protein WJX82_000047 [Trebouxia sp. C0006]